MSEEKDMITDIEVPIYLKYNFTAGAAPARFLQKIKQGVITGQRCPQCSRSMCRRAVPAPPAACPRMRRWKCPTRPLCNRSPL